MIAMLFALAQLFGCNTTAPDYHVTKGSKGTPTQCIEATVERVEIRGVSSPSITDWNTRAVARTGAGKTLWWDYSRSLLPGPPLETGRMLFLLLDADGAAAGVALQCPANLAVHTPGTAD